MVFKPETKEVETRALCIEIGMRLVTEERPKGTDKMPYPALNISLTQPGAFVLDLCSYKTIKAPKCHMSPDIK